MWFNLLTAGQRISQSVIDLLISQPKLRIALISYHYQKPTISGVGIHVLNLAKYLVRQNCSVHVFCSDEEDLVYKEDGVVVHSIGKILAPSTDNFSKKMLEYDLFESEVIKEMIREHARRPFDLIHTHGALTKAAFIFRKVYGTKWIHTFHAIEKMRLKKLSAEEKQFADLVSWIESTVNYCDGAIFVSQELSREGNRHYKLKSQRIIPNGVDLEMFTYKPNSSKNVLFIGRFSKEKGVQFLPQIMEQVMRVKDATFTLVGPFKVLDEELKHIHTQILRLKQIYKERLTIVEKPQDQEDLVEFYLQSQVYIQPSKYESFGLCILEAMAIGRPVVAFNVGGIPELLGDTGFLAKNNKELTKIVINLLNNPEKCVAIGEQASKRAQEFDWEIVAKKTIQYYCEVRK